MIGYKGFDKDFKCDDFQFEVGTTYHYDDELKPWGNGFHFYTNPLQVLNDYPPLNGNRYALVEVKGNIITHELFSKNGNIACTDEFSVVKELSLRQLIKAFRPWEMPCNTSDYSTAPLRDNNGRATATGEESIAINTQSLSVATNTGAYSFAIGTKPQTVAANTGNYSFAINSGYDSTAINTGYNAFATNAGAQSTAICTGCRAAAEVTNKNSVAIATGADSRAKGILGDWLVLAEWNSKGIVDLQALKVDGERIKPDTFYRLVNGQPQPIDTPLCR